MNVAFCTCRDTKCPLNPVNHDRGCTPCRAAFSTRWPLTGDRTRIIPIRALHSLCWRRSGPARRTRGRRARSRCNLRRRKLKNIHRIFFQAMRPLFTRAAAGGIVGMKNSGRILPGRCFFCAENLISASRRLRLRPTPALHSAPASLWSP